MGTVAEEHPELFHYTDINGLVGILQSQTLWATHYAFKNDSEEVQFFITKELPELLQDVVEKYLEEKINNDTNVLSEIELKGGKKYIVGDFIKETLTASENILFSHQDGKEPLAEPYIISFSTIKNVSESIIEHGLLSQWRGYGQNGGGYAIVFDTAGLSELLEMVGKKWQNGADLFFGDVVYSSESKKTPEFYAEFKEDLAVISKFYSNHLFNNKDSKAEKKFFNALMKCTCRYKHEGFKEENEVRIVAIPAGKQISGSMRDDGETVYEIPLKHYLRAGIAVPYIDLFEGITSMAEKPLPIKRIIVGPGVNSEEKNKKALAVKKLTEQFGINVNVSVSKIPYIG